ncbi:hypothetical protein [Bacillus anthracis]|uniref:hypothetical protein n=1 Tax=Bacillus anthracis TaxID=1392 RepID=UPI00099B9AD5|nr:hypothetical protein [Bacillus anthracis]OPD57622.1 hypothetical protein BVG01_18035 [Bacillus anthracis]
MWNPYDYYITPEEYEVAEKNGIRRKSLEYRIRRGCWDKEKAITIPTQKEPSEWTKIKNISLKNGISRQTFSARRKRGWSLVDAITIPPLTQDEIIARAKEKNPQKAPIFTEEQVKRAEENGISYKTLYDRVKRYKWDLEEAIATPILSASERGRKGKERSYWSKIVIPSREERMKHRKLTYIAN